MSECINPVVLAAAGGDVWKLLAEKAVLWPASLFLAHVIHVNFHETKAKDFFVTDYGVPHSRDQRSICSEYCVHWLACVRD